MSIPPPMAPTGVETTVVLVTGATGTVGSAVVAELLAAEGCEVHVAVRRDLPAHPRLHQHRVDLSDPCFHRALEGHDFSAIIHAAQPRWGETPSSDPALPVTFDLNVVRGLERLRTSPTCRWIYTSGVWAYGNQAPGHVITERTKWNPLALGRSRLATLHYLQNESEVPWTEVVLPSIVYGAVGPLQDIAHAIIHGTTQVPDDPSILWSVIERGDVARLFRRLIEHPLPLRRLMVAEPAAVSQIGIYETVAACLGRTFSPRPLGALSRLLSPAEFEVAVASQPIRSEHTSTELGWEPHECFGRTVPRFLNTDPAD